MCLYKRSKLCSEDIDQLKNDPELMKRFIKTQLEYMRGKLAICILYFVPPMFISLAQAIEQHSLASGHVYLINLVMWITMSVSILLFIHAATAAKNLKILGLVGPVLQTIASFTTIALTIWQKESFDTV